MKPLILLLIICQAFMFPHTPSKRQTITDSPEVVAARKARDHASVEELQRAVAKARKDATETNSFDAYLRLAQIDVWLCEAIEAHENDKLFKETAEAGVAAAEKAVALNPKSSAAHQLLGDLLNQLIPHVFGGGMRYGKRANDELDKAIELDPKNADAYVSRAISYYYTPEAFGGSKSNAFELLQKAIESDPQADSPHIWLALFHLDAKQMDEAQREITLALKLNPERVFTQYVASQITLTQKPAAQKKQSNR